MAYFVEFTSGEYSECIGEMQDKAKAVAIGAEKQKEYEAAGKHGIITCYELCLPIEGFRCVSALNFSMFARDATSKTKDLRAIKKLFFERRAIRTLRKMIRQ